MIFNVPCLIIHQICSMKQLRSDASASLSFQINPPTVSEFLHLQLQQHEEIKQRKEKTQEQAVVVLAVCVSTMLVQPSVLKRADLHMHKESLLSTYLP